MIIFPQESSGQETNWNIEAYEFRQISNISRTLVGN